MVITVFYWSHVAISNKETVYGSIQQHIIFKLSREWQGHHWQANTHWSDEWCYSVREGDNLEVAKEYADVSKNNSEGEYDGQVANR